MLEKVNPLNLLRKRLSDSIVINPEAERQTLEILGKNRLVDYLKHGLGTSSIGALSGLTAENLKRLVEGRDIDMDSDMIRAGMIGAGIGAGASAITAPVKALIANKVSVPIEIRKSLLEYATKNPIRGGIVMKAPPTKRALGAVDSGIQLGSNAVRRLNNFSDDVAMMLPLAAVPAAPWFEDNFRSPFEK